MSNPKFHKKTTHSKKRLKTSGLLNDFSDEELARDWTLNDKDKTMLMRFCKVYRMSIAIQLCTFRLYGRFISDINALSPRIINYLNTQLDLPPSFVVTVATREATLLEQQKQIFKHLAFKKYTLAEKQLLQHWIQSKLNDSLLPTELISLAEQHLLNQKIALPAPSALRRQIMSVYHRYQKDTFNNVYQPLDSTLKTKLDKLLQVTAGNQRSFFASMKEYPPHANTTTLNLYLDRYQLARKIDLSTLSLSSLGSKTIGYLYLLAKRYDTDDMQRFANPKRYTMLICFLIEARKQILDYIIELHDQFITDILRRSKNSYNKRFQDYRKRTKQANDVILNAMEFILDREPKKAFTLAQLYEHINEKTLKTAIEDGYVYKRLVERGYADSLCARYATLRRYFSKFVKLSFETECGNQSLLKSIRIIRKLDAGELAEVPANAPHGFVPANLKIALKNDNGHINRNVWEMSLAIAIRNALRSGDLYLAESKQHISFWNLVYDERTWRETKSNAYEALNLTQPKEAITKIKSKFKDAAIKAGQDFDTDDFATIEKNKLKLSKDDKLDIPDTLKHLQKAVDDSLPKIRIEDLLIQVDKETHFSQSFQPLSGHQLRPKLFYKTLMAAIIAHATNLGTVAMANSTPGVSVSQLRRIMDHYIRDDTIKLANARIVDQHHKLPWSSIYGAGHISSSDGQRFGISASSLLGTFYPRYYGYYDHAIGVYTHVSDQYSVFGTKVISCSPREALYVLDGLLENNTILSPVEHTTDTAGFTEHIFALCYLLGYHFMPRIRDLKDQQLYKPDRKVILGPFDAIIRKTVKLDIIEEQWDQMVRVAASLKQRLTPAHIIVQRLIRSSPSDRLTKAFTELGRLIKTEYILRYLTDPELRRRVHIQLNRGEYRHKLSRWVFFANQGEFQIGNYEEIMNKVSCLSLVSNAVLYWNTPKIGKVITALRDQGEDIPDALAARISPLPYKHVIPNGTYFTGKVG